MSLHPRWLTPTRYWQAQLRSPHKAWLLSQGSLTAYLMALSHGDFRVQVQHEAWQKPSLDERLSLNLPQQQYAWVREVALLGHHQVWVTARSIIPQQTLVGRGKRLKYLGSRSLGSLLFKGGKRGQLVICSPNSQHHHWTRRSLFYYANRPLLVQEKFLPALFEAAQQQQICV